MMRGVSSSDTFDNSVGPLVSRGVHEEVEVVLERGGGTKGDDAGVGASSRGEPEPQT